MSAEAAEPGAASVSPEELELAVANLKEGKDLLDDDPEKAVELLCSVVKTYEKKYGSDGIECADVYLYYGIALYEVARNATDALGTTKTTVEKKTPADGAGPSTSAGSGGPAAGEAGAAQTAAAAGAEGEGEGEGKDEEEGGEEGAEGGEDGAAGGEDGGEGEGGDGDGEDAEGSPTDDMKLAWEMIELARIIYDRNSPEQHHSKLAEVHKSLGDIKSEEERFEEAADCYRQSIVHLQAMQPPSLRRIAEVQYKLSLSLTFMEQPEAALAQTEEAIRSLEAAVGEIEEKLAALPTDGSGGEEAEEEGRRLQGTADDLRGVMTELTHNCEGLRDTIKHNNSLKEALKQAFIKANGGAAALAGAGGGSSTSFAAPTNAAAAAATVSLGVVGRGTKRITLQPAAAAPQGQAAAADGSAAAPAPKRTLADLMGVQPPVPATSPTLAASGQGASVVGATAAGTADGQAQAQEPAKRARLEESAAAPAEAPSADAAK
ncbi:hypothetical protein HYH02_007199 [Chlamydomonas schloesseri]|uniref:Tetratricopeptide SHNi-TPR domain-containing protein n=1 Tax=Chlamydomonas schloesseri TaxID=2026947 RepID=A0A835WI89_9CHLO|nr:hypothetical protein HYH02_007199 [Chlamydomonas schloesseri]|eukprot:KAG2447739.1 hypothetical protein HYH02_007199 [Chlamydomonas schloesseri]